MPPRLRHDASICGGSGLCAFEALERMRQAGKEPPRGILALDNSEWAVPIIFGVDAESKAAAVAFAIDHNNLTLAGSKLDFHDVLAIWDEEGLQRILADAPDATERLARYLLRPPLSLERMSWDEAQGPVLYRAKRARGFAKAEKSFDPQDFLARLLMHDRAA